MTSRKVLVTKPDALVEQAKSLFSRPYARRLTPDESGGYTATIQEFPGCIADGDSPSEALANLESAALSWIEAQLALQQPIPEPIQLYGYSGKLALRIPRGLHKRVAEMAMSEGASINQFLTNALATFVGAKSIADRLVEDLRPTLIAHTAMLLSYDGIYSASVLQNHQHSTNTAEATYIPHSAMRTICAPRPFLTLATRSTNG
ncbi:MAG: type II toxin-antitoxin system HicB family antitoxin [Xanthomonadaceae bacterium]|nr:type II toxin-antitoxin system HicB family antitoxin [Xanthomonadaceae bacterium]